MGNEEERTVTACEFVPVDKSSIWGLLPETIAIKNLEYFLLCAAQLLSTDTSAEIPIRIVFRGRSSNNYRLSVYGTLD